MKEGYVLLVHVRKRSFTRKYKKVEINWSYTIASHPIIFGGFMLIFLLALGFYIDLIFIPLYWDNILLVISSWLKSTFDLSLII